MKIPFLKFKSILILLIIGFSLGSCSSDNDATIKDNTGGKDMVATVAFESQDPIEFGYNFPNFNIAKPSIVSEKGSDQSILLISGTMDNYSIGITAVIDGKGDYSYIEGFDEEGNETAASITLNISSEDELDTFVPFRMSDETIGSVKLSITTLTEDKIKASFSATLYSYTTGEKVVIKNGKVDSRLFRKEFAPQ